VRREEIFAHYGGEEFAILMPETTLEGAVSLAENVRGRVAAHRFEFQGVHIPVTVSLGVAELSLGAAEGGSNDLVALADAKLYEAKRGGRNRVCS